jgi:hypothetical protein
MVSAFVMAMLSGITMDIPRPSWQPCLQRARLGGVRHCGHGLTDLPMSGELLDVSDLKVEAMHAVTCSREGGVAPGHCCQ